MDEVPLTGVMHTRYAEDSADARSLRRRSGVNFDGNLACPFFLRHLFAGYG
jgi:hypothetical protein